MAGYKKYFLMDNKDIVESQIFLTGEFEITRIMSEGVDDTTNRFDIIMYDMEQEVFEYMDDDGYFHEYFDLVQVQVLVGTVIMQSDNRLELEVLARLK